MRAFAISLLVAFLLVSITGSLAGAVVFTEDTLIEAGDTTYDGQDVIVDNCALILNGHHSFANFTVTNNGLVTHSIYSSNTENRIDLTITGDLSVDTGSEINADGRGHGSGEGPGAGASGYYSGGGGGYGGSGGDGVSSGGPGYGSLMLPVEFGSGGGASNFAQGGFGGGVLRLLVDGSLFLNGSLSANGTNGLNAVTSPGGGGSGGSIAITAGALSGNGIIAVNGGSSPETAGHGNWVPSGGGGGGRIAILCDDNTFSGILSAEGGWGENYGGAGTIYTKSSLQTYGTLRIDNGAHYGATTPLIETTYRFDDIQVLNESRLEVYSGTELIWPSADFLLMDNGHILVSGRIVAPDQGVFAGLTLSSGSSLTIYGSSAISALTVDIPSGSLFLNATATFPSMHIGAGGVLSHSAGQSGFDLTITGDLVVDPGGVISADGKGYGPSGGPGAGTHNGTAGSGGGFGGAGGDISGAAGGGPYCPTLEPVDFGSGGGDWSGTNAGSGGGAIRLTIDGAFILDGSLSANGTEPVYTGNIGFGGGSGGSIFLVADILEGSGEIAVNGGDGWVGSSSTGGGGGGGHIVLYLNQDNFSGSILADGGTGINDGEPGIVQHVSHEDLLTFNHQVYGRADAPCSFKIWEFPALADQQLRLTQTNTSEPGLVYDLFGPMGWRGFSGIETDSSLITLTDSGRYLLTARDASRSETRNFSYRLQETSLAELSPGAVYSGNFMSSGQAQLCRIELPESTRLRIRLDDAAANNVNEIYVKLGSPPTRGSYDYRFGTAASSDQQIVVPMAVQGTWYVLVYGDIVNTPSAYTLLAETSDIFLQSVTPDHHGIGVDTLVALTGVGFEPGTQVEMVNPVGTRYPADTINVDSSTHLTAWFSAASVPIGIYSIVASNSGGDSDQITDAFEFTENLGARFEADLIVPQNLGYHQPATIWIEYANTGDVAMPAPLLFLTARQAGRQAAKMQIDMTLEPKAFWTSAQPVGYSDSIQFIAVGNTPGLLQPGESIRLPVQWIGWEQPWFQDDHFTFDLRVMEADEPTLVDWASLKESMQPDEIPDDAWEAVWQNFISQVGTTWGDYVSMLSSNASYLERFGIRLADISELLSFEFAQADGLNILRSLAASSDAYIEAPGPDVFFRRVFPQAISRRFSNGDFGRGWYHNWQAKCSVATDGTVTVLEANGSKRIYQPDSRPGGGYFSMAGDHATLTDLGGGVFALKEADGSRRAFMADGKLDYFEDTNGNRIAAGYTDDRLTSLNHSSGQSLQIAYNGNGRIASITDPVGRQTNYTYDSSGEHLISAAYFDGSTVSYRYETGGLIQREHALVETEFPMGRYQYFSYDDRGRLASASRDDGAELITFSYDNAGMVGVADAFGNTSRYYLDHNGMLRKAADPQGNAIALGYDQDFNLVEITDPAGFAYRYAYDDRGNVLTTTDPMGHQTQFNSTHLFNRLSHLTDARGNATGYDYDPAGNLTSITYADNSVERWTYDAVGNPDSWTNRRGNTMNYNYDSAGRLISKTYPDESQVAYIYDTRGNLITAIDPHGTTTLQYDQNDRLERITYPADRYLHYTYNAAGQRASMVDQLGHRLDYYYDDAGRLESITDETSMEIVRYHYDLAGRLERKELGNGVYTIYQYDTAGQLISLSNLKPDQSILSQFVYTYDERGRRTSMTTAYGENDPRTAGLWDYDYDEIGQLIGWTAPSGRRVEYLYDDLGNRVTVTDDGVATAYTTNTMNQYTQVGNTTYSYDTDGNLIQKTLLEGITTYTFNDENQLVAVSSPEGNWSYTYNAFKNRVRVVANGSMTDFVIDSTGFGNLVSEYGAGGTLIARYEHGFGLVSRANDVGSLALYTYDAIGNASELADETGFILNSYSYNPFGLSLSKSETIDNQFEYVGEHGVLNEENGLESMRARYYNSDLGKFLSQDPIGLNGGIHLYAYVMNNPTNLVDPLGLQYTCNYEGIDFPCNLWGKILEIWAWAVTDPPKTISAYWFPYEQHNKAMVCYYYGVCDGRWPETEPASSDQEGLPGPRTPPKPGLTPHDSGDPCNRPQIPPIPVPSPPTTAFQSSSSQVVASSDPNEKIGPTGYSVRSLIVGDSFLSYRVNFENFEEATAPAQIATISDQLDADLDWSTFELTGIGFGDKRITIPENAQHFETAISMTMNDIDFEVRVEAGIHLSSGEVYARFYSIDPATGLPPTVDTGFLPPEDGTGRGQGYLTYVIKPKADLPEGTEIRNVANITFDYQESIATNQVDPHDPSQGTDPTKECLNTIAPDYANLTVSSLAGGTLVQPSVGTHQYPWGASIRLGAVPDEGRKFLNWSGDVETVSDIYDPSATIMMYDDFSIVANFSSAEMTIPLSEGYNLLALPVDTDAQPDLRDWMPVIGNAETIEKVMAYDDRTGLFTTLLPENPANPSFLLKEGQALVVYANQDSDVTLSDTVCPAWDLKPGLNVVGAACTPDNVSAFDLLTAIGDQNIVTSIEHYDTQSGQFETAGYADGQPSGRDFPIHDGEGYMIFMKEEVMGFRP